MTRPRLGLVTLATLLVAIAARALLGAQSSPPLPPPQAVLGFPACADRTLATYEQIATYFRALDAASDRMQIAEIGTSTEGRPMLLAVISSEANLRAIDRYRDIARRLALARGLTDEQARDLAREGKAVVWVDFGLHSSELAHAQAAPEFAYRVVSEETDEMRFIRDNVVLLLMPNMNPDGTTLWAEWYARHVGGPFERSSPPVLYQKYVGHDNNRDWFMMTQPETRHVARQLYSVWFPQIVHNQHQSAPFPARIFHPPFEDPMNPNIPPLVIRSVNLVGEAMGRRFEQEGKSGSISRIAFDTWWNGGMRTVPYFHNMVGILTETAHTSPAPAIYDPATFPKTFSNGVSTLEPSTDYPNPYRGGPWRFRDSCEYMLTASMAVLDIGARRREQWLYDIYQLGRDAIRAGHDETYIVAADQWDPGTAVKMINVLREGAVEVERALAPFEAGGHTHAAGTYLIRGAQPFRPYLTDLLNPQVYPDRRLYPGGPPERPYDITGWTLPMQMGVRVDRVTGPVAVTTTPIDRAPVPEGRVTGVARAAYVIDPRANDAFIAVNRLLEAGARISRADGPLTVGPHAWPPGAFVVAAAGPALHARMQEIATALGLTIVALNTAPAGPQTPVRRARIGLYHAWGGNMDEGWTRWLLEQFEFPYVQLFDRDLRAGALRQRVEVIVLPNATYNEMVKGRAPGTMPEEYVGGMTPEGVAHLETFTREGGTLIALDAAASLPLTAFGLGLRNVTEGPADPDFYIPGTLVRVHVDASHPVGYGMPAETAAVFRHSAAFATEAVPAEPPGATPRTPKPPAVRTVVTYAPEGLLMSGWLMGERVIAGRAAVVEARLDLGRVVLLGFRAQHRAQPHATFKLLFNSLLLPPGKPPGPSRASDSAPAGAPR